ncbi:MAG: hypothetical protein JWM31_444, partial [Solirubrobacterales bacterium]|nr:hypothetical protein [Solirubrobacterales bacterium]
MLRRLPVLAAALAGSGGLLFPAAALARPATVVTSVRPSTGGRHQDFRVTFTARHAGVRGDFSVDVGDARGGCATRTFANA